MRSKRRWGAVVALVALAAIGVAGAQLSTAVAFFSNGLSLEMSVGKQGTLVAKGVGVKVPVTIECNADRAFVEVQLSERSGRFVVRGYGSTSVKCTGDKQRLKILVQPRTRVFKSGTALASADIFGCGFHVCGDQPASREIKISHK